MTQTSLDDSSEIARSRPAILANLADFLYPVSMQTGKRWGLALVGSVAISLLVPSNASAQTPPPAGPVAPPPSMAQPAPTPGVVQNTAAPAGVAPAMQPVQPQSALVPNQVPPQQQTTYVPGQPSTQPQQQAPQPPIIQLQKDPALPPPVMRTDHVHDGFYARLGLGFGQLGTTMNTPESGAIDGDGSTLALDVAIGYAVSPGIVLGGTLMAEQMPSVELGGMSPVVSDVGAMLIGPFFDGYPNARGGFHLGGALGAARTTIQREEVAGFKNAGGLGLAGWVGYDIWVASQWSAGLQLQVMGTRTKADAVAVPNNDNLGGSATMATRSIALMLTGLYN